MSPIQSLLPFYLPGHRDIFSFSVWLPALPLPRWARKAWRVRSKCISAMAICPIKELLPSSFFAIILPCALSSSVVSGGESKQGESNDGSTGTYHRAGQYQTPVLNRAVQERGQDNDHQSPAGNAGR